MGSVSKSHFSSRVGFYFSMACAVDGGSRQRRPHYMDASEKIVRCDRIALNFGENDLSVYSTPLWPLIP